MTKYSLLLFFLGLVPLQAAVLQQYKVFSELSEGYKTFRIPGLVQSATGNRLLAFAEGRVATDRPTVGNASLCYGLLASRYDSKCVDKDIVYKKSDDGGKNWSPSMALTKANATFFYSNPNAAVDPRTGHIYLLYARCEVTKVYGDCVDILRESADNGDTFSDPRAYPDLPAGIGGPGGGWVVRHAIGHWQGRVVFGKQGRGILYSDDGGREWTSGPTLKRHGENQIAETANGSLVMAMRSGYTPSFFRSIDGGMEWHEMNVSSLMNPNCQVSLTSFEKGTDVHLLFSHPNTKIEPEPLGRQNMTVHYSSDGGNTWNVLAQVYEGCSAYSSVIQINATFAACLYERSESPPPINFESVHIAFIPVH